MARVIETHPDANGLCRKVTLEARPRGGPLGLPHVPKDLETFKIAVQRLVLIHPRELEIPKLQDFATTQEKVTAEDLTFAKEKPEAEDAAIAMEKPAPEDSDTTPEKDTTEKAEMAADTTPEKDTPEKAKMAADEEDLEMTDAEDPKKVNLNSGA